MSTTRVTSNDPALVTAALARDQGRAVFGQVMGLVAITVGLPRSARTSVATSAAGQGWCSSSV